MGFFSLYGLFKGLVLISHSDWGPDPAVIVQVCLEPLPFLSPFSLRFSDALDILGSLELHLNTQLPTHQRHPDVPSSL